MKKVFILILTFALIIFSISIVFAAFSFKGQDIKTDYLAGETVSGTVNISFDKEPANSQITSNLGGNISLIDLLERNNFIAGTDFNCTTQNCISGYIIKNEISTLGLDEKKPRLAGFRITGKNVDIQSINFSVISDAAPSCIRQVLVNVLDKNEIYIQNPKYTASACDVVYSGCFNNTLNSGNYIPADITSTPYCEKIILPPSAAYEFGATVKNSTTGESDLEIKLYNSDWGFIDSCMLSKNTKDTDDLKCIINYTNINPVSYFVCAANQEGATTNYKIRTEQTGNICGTGEVGSEVYSRDFEIFARALQFDLVNIPISDKIQTNVPGSSLVSNANDYVQERYGGDCSTGCIIPFEFTGKLQTLTLGSPQILYKSEGILLSETKMYTIDKEDTKISSDYLNLELRPAGFRIPINESGQKRIEINITNGTKSNNLFSTLVNVSPSFDFDVNPKFALIGIETDFNIVTSLNVSSTWNFGDGTSGFSGTNNIIHKYLGSGDYDLTVELTRQDGTRAAKTFRVIVGEPKESALKLLERYEKRIANITDQIALYPGWIKIEIEQKVDPIALNATLSQIRTDYDIATTDDAYIAVIKRLQAFEVPEAIAISKSGTLPPSLGFNNIDTNYIEEISAKEVSGEEEVILKRDIISWIAQNYDIDVNFEVFLKFVDSKETPVLTKFKIKVVPKPQASTEPAYLIINYPTDAIRFMKAYAERPTSSGTFITLSGINEEFEFILPSYVEVSSLGAYVSPDINRLSSGIIEIVRPKTRAGWIIFWLLILLIATLTGYVILQEWYKRHYESYLFKSKDDLYNLVNFIYNSRSAGLKDVEIRKKLVDSTWKAEQIIYAFNKIDGKRTGMYEIPVLKWVEMIKVKREIQKRQKKPIDTRFIKRPAV